MPYTAISAELLKIQKSQVDAMNSLREMFLTATEKAIQLHSATARAVWQDSTQATQTLLGAKDVKDVVSISSALTEPTLGKVANYSRNLWAIFGDTRAQVLKFAETQVAQASRQLTEFTDLATQNAPAASAPVVSMLKSAATASQSLLEAGLQGAKQAADWTESNLAGLTAAATTLAGNTREESKTKGKHAA